jgi:hypothetical protein
MTSRLLILFSFFCFCFFAVLFSDEHDGMSRFQQDLNENDFEAVRDFVRLKRIVPLADKVNNLTISGDVRVDWRYIREKLRGEEIRGGDGVFIAREELIINDEIYQIGERIPLSNNVFDVQFNLYLDYVTDCTWAVAHVAYDNSMGVDDNGIDCSLDPEGYHGSASADNLNLVRAYMGYTIYCCNDTRLDVELGRRGFLYDVFDSQIQFLSRFDGIVFTYSTYLNCIGPFYIKAAGFVVDERVNHFGWGTEIGLLNICDTGIDFKYSFVDWRKNGENRCFARNPIGFKFLNSQWQLAYNFIPQCVDVPTQVFAGFLINHGPANYTFDNEARISVSGKNTGWYVGFTCGEVCQEGDWSFQGLYAYVGAHAMPDNDVRKIGTGNALLDSFTANAVGNVNFKGFQLAFLYAVTDNLLVNSLFDYSRPADKNIGGSHEYAQYKLEAIYAF